MYCQLVATLNYSQQNNYVYLRTYNRNVNCACQLHIATINHNHVNDTSFALLEVDDHELMCITFRNH